VSSTLITALSCEWVLAVRGPGWLLPHLCNTYPLAAPVHFDPRVGPVRTWVQTIRRLAFTQERREERDASTCMRRHQASALAPVRSLKLRSKGWHI